MVAVQEIKQAILNLPEVEYAEIIEWFYDLEEGGVTQPLRRPHPGKQRPGPPGQRQLPDRRRGGQLPRETVAPPKALGRQGKSLTPQLKPDITRFTTLLGWVNDSVNPWVNDAVNRQTGLALNVGQDELVTHI